MCVLSTFYALPKGLFLGPPLRRNIYVPSAHLSPFQHDDACVSSGKRVEKWATTNYSCRHPMIFPSAVAAVWPLYTTAEFTCLTYGSISTLQMTHT